MNKTQRDHWDAEHGSPAIHPSMDAETPSGAMLWLLERLTERDADFGEMRGLEMGCGKGRNTLFLAEKGLTMSAFDFSRVAIAEAKKRAEEKELAVEWKVADAGECWPYRDQTFDLGIDCYASSDIDSPDARAFAREEWKRVLKPGGYLLVATLSDRSPYHARMIGKHPGPEDGSFLHPSGKFEKTFSEEEMWELYQDFELLGSETHRGKAVFDGKEENTENHWFLFGI